MSKRPTNTLRHRITLLHLEGYTPDEITEKLACNRAYVFRIIRQYEDERNATPIGDVLSITLENRRMLKRILEILDAAFPI